MIMIKSWSISVCFLKTNDLFFWIININYLNLYSHNSSIQTDQCNVIVVWSCGILWVVDNFFDVVNYIRVDSLQISFTKSNDGGCYTEIWQNYCVIEIGKFEILRINARTMSGCYNKGLGNQSSTTLVSNCVVDSLPANDRHMRELSDFCESSFNNGWPGSHLSFY